MHDGSQSHWLQRVLTTIRPIFNAVLEMYFFGWRNVMRRTLESLLLQLTAGSCADM